MVASVPALYPTSQLGFFHAADREARKWSERLSQNLIVLNAGAAAVVLGLFWTGSVLPFDDFFVLYLALFVIGLASSLIAMFNNLSKIYNCLPLEQSKWLLGVSGFFRKIDTFWFLFFGLFSFLFGAACGLIALSTSWGAGAATAALPQPVLTQAAVGYWEGELTNAMLAGDRALFLRSCDSLTELRVRPEICNLSAGRP